MALLDDLTPGMMLKGIRPQLAVTIVAVTRHSVDSAEIVYKDAAGGLGTQLVYRDATEQVNDLTVEILQHLTSRLDCQVEVTLEISATDLSGFPEDIQRIIKENCATLKFERDVDFEEL